MKRLKRILRICALILFMLLSVAGIGIFGVAPTLTKDRKLFSDMEAKTKKTENNNTGSVQKSLFYNLNRN